MNNENISYSIIECTKEEFERGNLYGETELEQRPNNVETTSEQCTNNVETTSEQHTNNVPTTSVQRLDKNRTSIARGLRRPNESHFDIYNDNRELIKMLKNKFIHQNTMGIYNSISDLPLTRAPQDLTNAVNAHGFNVSRDELAKVYTAANVCSRVPKWKMYCILVAVVFCAVFTTNAYHKFETQHFTLSNVASNIASNTPQNVEFEQLIADFEKRNKFKFYPYRKGLILKQLQQQGTSDAEKILQQNMVTQIKATKK